MENSNNKKQDFGSIKFDSIKLWKSKNGKLFYMIKIGSNTIFVAENLLLKIKEQNLKEVA